MAAATCGQCDWTADTDRHDAACAAADRHEAATGHTDIDVC